MFVFARRVKLVCRATGMGFSVLEDAGASLFFIALFCVSANIPPVNE